MSTIQEILTNQLHRPYVLPAGNWIYYQEWNRALFLHWQVPYEVLRKCVPAPFIIDRFEGNCYISLVAFTMEKIRPRFLPSVNYLSNFDEINIRTYIDHNNKKGVYFLNIEAGKTISAYVAKLISGLPYEKAFIKRTNQLYLSKNVKKQFQLHTEFETQQKITHKSELDNWLTERYCLYLDQNRKHYRYDIHHKAWQLNQVAIKHLHVHYRFGEVDLGEKAPDLAHYSEGVQVIAWKRQQI